MAKSWLILVKIQDPIKNLQLPYPAIPDILKSKVRGPVQLVQNVLGPKNATWLNSVTLSLQVFKSSHRAANPHLIHLVEVAPNFYCATGENESQGVTSSSW